MIIDFYVFCMGLGFLGLLMMLVLGLGHHGDAGHGGGPDFHGGHFHLNGYAPGHADHAEIGHGPHETGAQGGPWTLTLLSYLAPRVWFSLIFGLGAAGCLLSHWLSGPLLAVLAVALAWGFERGLVRPVWNFMLRFASNPARTLESAVFEEAVAETNFDAQGTGLISVTLDGQVHQMLGMIQGGKTPRVHAGERLTIVGIDPHRNTCTVARRGTSLS
jgi:hypothetical protein